MLEGVSKRALGKVIEVEARLEGHGGVQMTTDFGPPYQNAVETTSTCGSFTVITLILVVFALFGAWCLWRAIKYRASNKLLFWSRLAFSSIEEALKDFFPSLKEGDVPDDRNIARRKVFDLTRDDLCEMSLPALRTTYEDFQNHSEYGEVMFRMLLDRSPDLFEGWFDENVSHEHRELLLIYRLEKLSREEAIALLTQWVEQVQTRTLQPVVFLKRMLTRSHCLWDEDVFLKHVHRTLNAVMENNAEGFHHLLSQEELSKQGKEVLVEYAYALCQRSAGNGLSLQMRMDLCKSRPAESFSREFFEQLMRIVPFPESLELVELARAVVPELTALSALESTANSSFLLRNLVDDDALYGQAVAYLSSHMERTASDGVDDGKQIDTIASGLFRARQCNHRSPVYMASRQQLLDNYVKLAMDVPDRARQTLQILHLVEDRTSNQEEQELFRQARERIISALSLDMHRGTVTLFEDERQQVGGLTEV